MAATRRGQPELHVRLPEGSQTQAQAQAPTTFDLPPISALFLIEFDVKAGYTISWKEHKSDFEIEGVVEYKSLPSGLHTVSDDLIYFVHEGHAGLSAFVNAPVDDSETRNARMLAVGVLVPLSYGRLGRAWKHAENLKALASQSAIDAKETSLLSQYWEQHRSRDNEASQPERPQPKPTETPIVSFQASPKPRGHARNRSMSDGAALIAPGHRLSPYHPAWSLTRLLDTFGPLIFPIQRAALLRKRILISCHAPVHEICNFVYNISILSNIPLSTFSLLSPNSNSPHRLRPLFTVGVHDIPFLMTGAKFSTTPDDSGAGWIACTTDSILATKDTLCDMLITLPPSHTDQAREHIWPIVECPRGTPVKATQRDLRRYRSLRAGLARLQNPHPHPHPHRRPSTSTSAVVVATTASPSRASTDITTGGKGKKKENTTTTTTTTDSDGDREDTDTELTEDDERTLVEPLTWAALAYSGFMWWASAGEQARSDEAEEAAHDAALLAGLSSTTPSSGTTAYSASTTPTMNMNMSLSASVDLGTSVGSLARAGTRGGGVRCGGGGGDGEEEEEDEDEAKVELATIAYFHRLTTQILTTLAEVVAEGGSSGGDESDEEDLDSEYRDGEEDDEGEDQALLSRVSEEEGGDSDDDDDDARRRGASGGGRSRGRRSIGISSQAMTDMGLDVWSASDAVFVVAAVETYFGRRAYVEGKGFEVCGVRVC